MKSSAQFFRATTGIQSGPDAFDKSAFIMTFLSILGFTEILRSFRLAIEGKTHKEIEFLESFQQTILLYHMQKTTPPGR